MLNKIFQVRIGEKYGNNKLEWTMSNYWGGYSDYFINNQDSKVIQDTIKLILSSQTTINKGDIVYASKASEIPRFKLKEFIKEKGLKKTSRYNHADVIIVNKGYFNELIKEFKYKNYTFVNEDFVKSNWKKWSNNNNSNIDRVNSIMNESKNINNIAIIDEYTIRDLNKIFTKYPNDRKIFDDNTHQEKGIFINLYRNERLRNLLSIIYELKDDIKAGKIRIAFDEDVFVELNKEGIELDDEYLQTLRDMLFSEDKANVKLGFEMMSNLVVNESMLLSVSFLLNELMHTTSFRPSHYTSSNTNLKSLFKLLKTRGIIWERDWKTFGTGLRVNFKSGKEGDIVKKFLLDNINREFKLSNSAAESLVDIVFSTETQTIN